jgi:hypothetical protein
MNKTKILEDCGPCPVFAGFTLAFDLQRRKKARKKPQSGWPKSVSWHGDDISTYKEVSRNKVDVLESGAGLSIK